MEDRHPRAGLAADRRRGNPMSTQGSPRPEERLTRSAVRWAGGARGQILVDAAARLADGLDSPIQVQPSRRISIGPDRRMHAPATPGASA